VRICQTSTDMMLIVWPPRCPTKNKEIKPPKTRNLRQLVPGKGKRAEAIKRMRPKHQTCSERKRTKISSFDMCLLGEIIGVAMTEGLCASFCLPGVSMPYCTDV
jgi:hypothetical protein